MNRIAIRNGFFGIFFALLIGLLTACGGGDDGGGGFANSVPVADAGADQQVISGETVTLDGSGSNDAEGDVLTFNWSITEKPGRSLSALDGSTIANPTLRVDRGGTYVVTLVVHDGTVDSPADTATITVQPKVAVMEDDWHPELAEFLTGKGLVVDDAFRSTLGLTVFDGDNISGDYVVWQDFQNGNWDIFAYQISTGTEFQVTTNIDAQQSPDIDGNYIIWEDKRNGNVDIFAYEISTEIEFPVTTDPASQSDPRVDGNFFVWSDLRNGNWDIFARHLPTSIEFQVTTDSNRQTNPQIDGDYIVWVDTRNGNIDIFASHIPTLLVSSPSDAEFQVTTDTGNRGQLLQIDGDYIVWEDFRNGPTSDIFAYQISTQTEFPVTEAENGQSRPHIDGDTIVWSDLRNGNRDIFAYQISTGIEFPVTTAPADQNNPRIDGDYIVWSDFRNGPTSDIFAYQISTQTEIQIAVDSSRQSAPQIQQGRVVWVDSLPNATNIFLADVADLAKHRITVGKLDSLNIFQNINDYAMVLFGDSLNFRTLSEITPNIFDVADAAGVNMLGVGTSDNNNPLGQLLADDGRFGLSANDDCCTSPMEIDVTQDGQSHPIYNGLDTSATLFLETSNADEMDEQVYITDPNDPNSPFIYTP